MDIISRRLVLIRVAASWTVTDLENNNVDAAHELNHLRERTTLADPITERILKRIFKGIIAGLAGTVVLWILKLAGGAVPQLETIAFLDHVADSLAATSGLPELPAAGWLWHLVIGSLWWGALFGIMVPVLPGRRDWFKGTVFGAIAAFLVMIMVMPLAGAGYFGMDLSPLEPMITFVYHLIYGVVLGAVYGLLATRRTANA